MRPASETAASGGAPERLLRLGGLARRARRGTAELGERVRDHAVRVRVNRHAAVARVDLDQARALVETRPPLDDAVAARIDRDVAHTGRDLARQGLPEARAAPPRPAAVSEKAAPSERPQRPDREHLSPEERMDCEGVGLRRAERDDAGDEIGPAHGQHLGEFAAAALADDRDLLAPPTGHELEALPESLDHRRGAVE